MYRGSRLKEAVRASYVRRWQEKYSDEALAARAHISANTVRRLWAGLGVELNTLLAIADAADMSIVDMLSGMQGRSDGHAEPSLAQIVDRPLRYLNQLLPVTEEHPSHGEGVSLSHESVPHATGPVRSMKNNAAKVAHQARHLAWQRYRVLPVPWSLTRKAPAPLGTGVAILTASLLLLAGAVGILTFRAVSLGWHGPIGQDFDVYLGFTRNWLDGRGWYLPSQFAPYVIEDVGGNAYPPVLLYLMVPFTVLPAILWWGIPIGIVAATIWRARPAWWAWPLLAGIFCYTRTWTLLVTGNPSMWAIAFAVAGLVWGWPAVGAALKLTFAPLALIGAPRRSWWLALITALLLCVPFGTLWAEYVTVILNGTSSRGVGYILGEWPIVLSLIAVVASGDRHARDRTAEDSHARGQTERVDVVGVIVGERGPAR